MILYIVILHTISKFDTLGYKRVNTLISQYPEDG